MSEGRESDLFQALVMQLTQAGWVALGKVPNPVSGTIERSLPVARYTIDTLGALEARTRGNLNDEERRLLERALRELRMNYLDEAKKAPAEAPGSGAAPGSGGGSGSTEAPASGEPPGAGEPAGGGEAATGDEPGAEPGSGGA